MKCVKLSCLAVLVLLSACVHQSQEPETVIKTVKAYQENVIALENLKTREVAYCYASQAHSAEECALEMEKYNFVRLKDIPLLTADRNILTEGTYPTRRWREKDRVSRW